jgi:hypothetical protein
MNKYERLSIHETGRGKMKNGDKILTIYGKTETVMAVELGRVITYESARQNSWYHPTKVFNIDGSVIVENVEKA